ncbi:MAG: hypothetical protein KAQ68_05090 [Clostridiales bacterium]|nr:hypothetical protein [Clostridiales bacterium]
MKQLQRKWEILVVHHSHTDIGYTHRQELIELYHIGFIRQAVDISQRILSGENDLEGFRWTCETFWAVEKFLDQATPEEKEMFELAVKKGHIEITGNYLNQNDIIDYGVLANVTKRSVEYAKQIGCPIDCAMTADINGYSWGYSQMLHDLGIRNFVSCLHIHHGMFVGEAKQRPFYWETPKGDKLLVWMGEHYTLANELGIVPGAFFSYTIHDKYNRHNTTFNTKDRYKISYERITDYLENLEHEDYPYDFVPAMASGLVTDNAPPNAKIMENIHRWNKEYGGQVTIKMVSLSEFFEKLNKEEAPIPTYKGDWPDWWADGMGSSPLPVKMFREAQRIHNVVKLIDADQKLSDPETVKKAEDMMMVYAEHTWGYSASMGQPWTRMVHNSDFRNIGYANNAHELVYRNYDRVLQKKGMITLAPIQSIIYKIENPYDSQLDDVVRLYINSTIADLYMSGYILRDAHTHKEYINQIDHVARGIEVCVPMKLKPKECVTLEFIQTADMKESKKTKIRHNSNMVGAGDIATGYEKDKFLVSESSIESNTVQIKWSEKGIYSWIDKTTSTQLIREDNLYNAFTPIYEVTNAINNDPTSQSRTRSRMRRNRKGLTVQRSAGVLVGVKNSNVGNVFAQIELEYQVTGTHFYNVVLTVHHHSPKVDVAVRINKTNQWSPENLYIALPFSIKDGELWAEKSGSMFRPRIDQIHNSNMDYYSLKEGLGVIKNGYGIAIATPDTPLVQLGSLEHKPVKLHDENNHSINNDHIYSWVMNNFWETNFKATLGEIYEFEYHIDCGAHVDSAESIQKLNFQMNAGAVEYRVGKIDK